VPLWVVDLIEVEGDSLREIAQGFLDRVALAGYIDLKTLRYVPVLFPVDRGGQVARHAHGLSVTPESRSVVLSLGCHAARSIADLEGERSRSVGLPQV
jgi:hypothetical protein